MWLHHVCPRRDFSWKHHCENHCLTQSPCMGTAGGGGVINPVFIHVSTHTLQRIIKELKNSITCKCDIHSDIFLPKDIHCSIPLCQTGETKPGFLLSTAAQTEGLQLLIEQDKEIYLPEIKKMCDFLKREISFKVSQSGPIPKLEEPTGADQSQPCHHAAGEREALPGTQSPAKAAQSILVSLLTGCQCSRNSTGKRGFGG